MSERPFSFGCILLAAGASVRMGRPKQLLSIDGRPLIARAAEAALASPAWPVVVVLGAHAEKIRPALARWPLLVVQNFRWQEGLASSIRAGLETIENFSRGIDAALISPIDQPAFSADVIARLVTALHAGGKTMASARYADRLGSPALFRRAHFDSLRGLRGDEGARSILAALSGDVAAVEFPGLSLDLDTPEDFEKFCRRTSAKDCSGTR
jgi:molybdenum cofactor cytidylyltransferase